MVFAATPWRKEADITDTYFRIFSRNGAKNFFKRHPATRNLYENKTLDEDLMNLISSMMAVDQSKRFNDVN